MMHTEPHLDPYVWQLSQAAKALWETRRAKWPHLPLAAWEDLATVIQRDYVQKVQTVIESTAPRLAQFDVERIEGLYPPKKIAKVLDIRRGKR